jgi:hypothetical protein
MAEQRDSATPPKRRSGQRLTAVQRQAAQQLFLEAFAQMANFSMACRAAGVHRSVVYRWQEHDEAFALRYRQAEAEANDRIRAAIYRRAITGIEKPVHHNGRLVVDADGNPVTVREYSDVLLMFYAKSRMPEFRDRQQVELTGRDGGPVRAVFVLPDVLNQARSDAQIDEFLKPQK